MTQTRRVALIGMVGAVSFLVAFVLGTALNLATGTPLTGGLANAVLTAAALTTGVCAMPTFGTGTFLWLVFAFLSIPTMTMGPPGPHKLLVGALGGLLWDVSLYVCRGRKWAFPLAATVMTGAIVVLTFGTLVVFGLPGADKLAKALPFLLVVYLPLGWLGGWLGEHIYATRLRKLLAGNSSQMDAEETQGPGGPAVN